ncbi:CAP domain-containing protein [Verrucomicrobiaceae bacterium N1E253]|uniref:CAP domain-containing protein n=1 Tax=Oceaniferula marina TaxID=2748318 RepID=A0A851GPU8_9BACT|nr:CAP domain-containing protein [Oceaniferula marina]NWK56850.1 CAP domain-containing protein [Oceaniferula marina]
MNIIKPILTWAGAAIVITSLSSCSSSSNLTQQTAAPPNAQERKIAERVFSLVNAERAKAGKKAFRGNRNLNKMAQQHSSFQASSHLTKGKPSNFGSHNRAQYAYLKYGIENLGEIESAVPASNSDPARTAVNAWMKSAEHNRHLKQSWDLTGVGVHKANNKYYITMMVGVRPSGVPRSVRPGSIYH